MRGCRWLCAASLIGPLMVGVVPPAVAADGDAFYKGKTISVVVGYVPGGGSDLVARVFARNLGKYVPGNPTIIVRNMPGAGGVLAVNYVGSVARPDGLTAFFGTAPIVMQLLGDKALKTDLTKFEYIAATPGTQVFYMRADVKPGIKLPADIFKAEKFWIGGFKASSSKDISERMALDVLGIKYNYLTGLAGNGEARLAIQQKTTQAFLEGLPSFLGVTMPTMVKSGLVVPIFQLGIPADKPGTTERDPDAKDIPTVEELYRDHYGKAPSGAFWEAYLAATTPYSVSQRWLGLPSGSPKIAVQALREAAMKMKDDPGFKSDEKHVLQYELPVYPGERAARAIGLALAIGPEAKAIINKVEKEKGTSAPKKKK